MKKIWLGLLSLMVVSTAGLSTISCATHRLGWDNPQNYWTILSYHDFSQWMENVDLVNQEQWENNLTDSEKIQSWKMIQNVDVNNFMTIMNLTYQYAKVVEDGEIKPVAIDDLGGFYHNYGYAILKDESSFGAHLLNLKYDDQSLINEKQWSPLTKENYLSQFKETELRNKFEFQSKPDELLPIEMTITANDGRTSLASDILKIWTPIAQAIELGQGETEKLWNDLKSHHFEAFNFNFNVFWPTNKKDQLKLQTSFQFLLAFQF